jgi:sulfatase modifying factor 1
VKITSLLIIFPLLFLINGCDSSNSVSKINRTPQENEVIQNFIKEVKSGMIFVPGGKFWMGDFCAKARNKTADCTSDEDNKPLHEVELTSYSISKFKITHENYALYLKMKTMLCI